MLMKLQASREPDALYYVDTLILLWSAECISDNDSANRTAL
jgi:hypothetical protein